VQVCTWACNPCRNTSDLVGLSRDAFSKNFPSFVILLEKFLLQKMEEAQTRPHKIRRVEEEGTNEDYLSTLPLLVLSEVLDFLRGGYCSPSFTATTLKYHSRTAEDGNRISFWCQASTPCLAVVL